MKNRKKIMLGLLLALMSCVLAACLCACSRGTNGSDGKDGTNGKSAYEIWLDNGHTGTEVDFLAWLKGDDGQDGKDGAQGEKGDDGQDGTNGTDGKNGKDGVDGTDGKSAYEIWLDNGHTGTEAEFLTWLKGQDGTDGQDGKDGADGKSAYEIWLDNGHSGTEADFLTWLKGQDGQDGEDGVDGADGKSAYEIFLQYYPYYTGTEEQWIRQLVKGGFEIHTVTFQSDNADDIVKYVLHGYALTDIPEVPVKIGNDGKWSVTDFSSVTADMTAKSIYVTKGLSFSFLNQQTEYKVSKGNMNEQTEELYIPSEYNGKAVTTIDVNSFQGCNYLKKVIIPNSVTEIRDYAFAECSSLTSVVIPDGLRNIGYGAFFFAPGNPVVWQKEG